jgi:DNA modification methylase
MISIYQGDCVEVMRKFSPTHYDMCVTSPPYWGLRDYGVDGQIGLEDDIYIFVEKIVEVMREVKRVLRDDGTLWLNMGDSYAMSSMRGGTKDFKWEPKAGHKGIRAPRAWEASGRDNFGYKGKSRIPAGLKAKDLMGLPWRVAFALQADGWYLRQDIIWHKPNPMPESVKDRCTKAHEYIFLFSKLREEAKTGDGGRNKRSVWRVTTKPVKEAHFATYPPDLIEPCILAGSREGGAVLDPFGGSGTTGRVAEKFGRDSTLIELNPEYIEIAQKLIKRDMFSEVEIK